MHSLTSSRRRRTDSPRRRAVRRRGFTLIETALATVIVGVGVIAIVAAQQAFHQQNAWSTHASIAERLGNELREMTLNLPRHDPVTGDVNWGIETANESWVGDFDDLDDFDGDGTGLVFSAELGNGPINARREVIPDMDGWSQTVTVFNVDPLDVAAGPQTDFSTNMIMVQVVVSYQGPSDDQPQEMTTVAWIAPN
jgi:prepilin-type N-terminal cleavage/methylation domain-containing protein